jgi:tetratricopeptide (TPR) repeat protein
MKQNKTPFALMSYRLGSWYWEDGQPDKALEHYIAFAELGTDQHLLYLDILSSLCSKKDWDSMGLIVGKLRSNSSLARMAITIERNHQNEKFDRMVLQFVIHTGGYQILDDVYQEAIAISIKAKNHRASFHFRRALARALWAKSPVPLEEITTLLEAAAGDVPYTGMNMEETFFRVGYKLGTIYLDHAKQAQDAETAKQWLRKMAEIVPEQVSEPQMRLPLTLFAARYHKIRGDDDAARREAHNTLKMAVELLADGDDSNDMLAYSKIIHAVTPFGDVEHARTAAYLMKLESDPGTFKVLCSCKCNFESDDPGDMWRCMDCINVTLTSKCRDRVINKTLGYVCHPDHEQFNIRRWNGERKGDKVVPWKDGAITMEDWRSKLIRKYHLK